MGLNLEVSDAEAKHNFYSAVYQARVTLAAASAVRRRLKGFV